MDKEHPKKPFESKEMEDWLDSFFLDPFTTYLDETVFRIDLYESESAFIVEALLLNIEKENIDLSISKNELQIKVTQFDKHPPYKSHIKVRTVKFPFLIEKMKMDASFEQEILEIKIYKHST